jgi:hypothetical protein
LTPKGRAANMRTAFDVSGLPALTKVTDTPPKPLLGDAAQARATDREARRAAALRANLQRRKSQSRARHDDQPPSPAADTAREE